MLEIKSLNKKYKNTKALDNVSIKFPDSGFVFITGKSGSGKSSLLNIIGGLDRYDSGDIIINGKSSKQFKNNDWDLYRNTYVGIVFQEFNLIDKLTVYDNVKLALNIQKYGKNDANKLTLKLLEQVELLDKKDNLTSELSGGQKQRVATARALIKNPGIILADEPTGNLDSETSFIILNMLKEMSKDRLVIMVTHDTDFSNMYADRIIELKDGRIINDYSNDTKIDSKIKVTKGQNNISSIVEIESIDDETKELLKPHLNGNETHLLASSNNKYVSGYLEGKHTDDILDISSDDDNSFNLIRSKLPFRYIASMIAKSLKLKKLRSLSVFTTFIISLLLFSFTLLFLTYNETVVLEDAIPNANTMQFEFSTKRDDYGSAIGPLVTFDYIENLKTSNESAVFGYYDDSLRKNIFPVGGKSYNDEYGTYPNRVIIKYLDLAEANVVVDELNNIPHNIVSGSKDSTENDVILIPDFVADYILISEIYDQNLENYDDIIGKKIYELTSAELNEMTKDYKIVGIYETNLDSVIRNTVESYDGIDITLSILSQYSIYVKREYTEIEVSGYSSSGVFVHGDDELALKLLSDFDTSGNVLFESIGMVGDATSALTTILPIVLLIFTVLAGTLMYQYISITISYKKKEIGTLRALGARKIDIFKTYFIETLIIMAIVLILTAICSLFILNIINKQFSWRMESTFDIFYFTLTMKMIIVGFCGLVSLISSYYPIRQITRLKPIDAIRNTKS